MKRSNSYDTSYKHNAKRKKYSEDAARTILIGPTSHPFIPMDVIKYNILPFGSLDWLLISKEFYRVAIQYIVNDTRVLARSEEMLAKAAELRSLRLLERLLQDDRYTSKHTLHEAIGTVVNNEDSEITDADKQVVQTLLSHKLSRTIQPDNLLFTAIIKGWTNIVQHILAVSEHNFEGWPRKTAIYRYAPVEVIKLIRQDPRFYSAASFERALQSAISGGNIEVVCLLMQEERTDFHVVVRVLSHHSSGIKILLTNARLLESSNYQFTLWKEVITYNFKDSLQLILQDGKINPNLYADNYLLYLTTKCSSPAMVELLLQDQRIMPTKKPSKRNPVVVALKYRHKEVLEVLIHHPKIDSDWLDNAFIYIAKKGYLKSVKFALQNYKEEISNRAKHKALQSAKKQDYQNIIYVLAEYK